MLTLPTSALKFLICFIKNQFSALFIAAILITLWSINQSVFPYLIKIIMNKIELLGNDKIKAYQELKLPLIGLLCTWGIAELSLGLRGWIFASTMPKLKAQMRQDLYDYVKHHSYGFFLEELPGNIAYKISEVPRSCESIINVVICSFLPIAVIFLFSVIFLSTVSVFFSLITVFWFVIQIYFSLFFYKQSSLTSKDHAKFLSYLNGRIVDTLCNIMVVRLFSREYHESSLLKSLHIQEERKYVHALSSLEKVKSCQGGLNFIFISLTLLYLLYTWLNGYASHGDIPLVTMLSIAILNALNNFNFQIAHFFKELATIEAALQILMKTHEVKDGVNAHALKVTRGEIKFENVSFAYNQQKEIFSKLNVTIQGGEKVGIVGLTGSGKTTFISLIMRCYDIDSGIIAIDTQDIKLVTQQSLREQIAIVPYESWLLNRSVKDNISYGKLNATTKEIIEASKTAHAHEFISKLPNKYETIVGENGLRLSNGQQQRIALARAILKNAPIIIFDEATSALDLITEEIVQQKTVKELHNKTLLIIAHRYTALANVDRILVFHQGQIIEDGSKEQLMRQKGLFYKFWNMQQQTQPYRSTLDNGFLEEGNLG